MHVLMILFLRMLAWFFLSSTTLHADSASIPEQHFSKNFENKVHKTFHHAGPIAEEIVLYLPHQPIINHIPDAPLAKVTGIEEDGTKERYRFFMPMTSINQKTLDQLNTFGRSSSYYKLTVKQTDKPIKGLDVVVEFDKKTVGFQAEIFSAITGDKAVAFKFLMRQRLERINDKSHPLIRTAQAVSLVKKNFILL